MGREKGGIREGREEKREGGKNERKGKKRKGEWEKGGRKDWKERRENREG